MSEARPQLQAVPPEGEPSDLQAAVVPPERRSRRHALVWVLAVGLVGSAVGWAFEAQQNQELVVSLEATSVALLEARAELSAWEGHAGLAREQATALVGEVSGLGERIAELEALLAGGPTVSQDTDSGASAP